MAALDPRLLRRARPARVALVADAVLGLAAALLVLASGVLLAQVAARAFDGAPLTHVAVLLSLLAAVVAGRAAATWGFHVVGRRAAAQVTSQLRLDLVEHRLRESPAALDGVPSSEVATMTVTGVDALESVFARYLPAVVLAVVVPVAVVVLVGWVDPLSAVVMVLTLPLVPVFMWLIGQATRRRTMERWQALQALSTHFLDAVRGLPTLRAYNRSRGHAARIAAAGDDYRRATVAALRHAFLSGAVLDLAATLCVALLAVEVGIRLVDGDLTLAAGLTVLVLAPELYAPLRSLAAQYHSSADGLAVAARLLDLAGPPRPVERGTAAPPDPSSEPIRLHEVTFSYPARPGLVLTGIDLLIRPGETLAMVGPSGGGKSTIAAVLLRLAEPSSGQVTVGPVDLGRCDPGAWRRHLAWVPQHPTLFRGTVEDNIRLGEPGAGRSQVRAAARAAGADGFIADLPEGYRTRVGEGGRVLSAGQVQRIALARALLREAPLLVLDEPTSNLDPDSAATVRETVRDLHGRATVVLITHSADLASLADRVVQVEAGRLVDPDSVAVRR